MNDYLYVDGSTRLNTVCIYDRRYDKYITYNFKGGLTNNDMEWYAVMMGVRYYNETRCTNKFSDRCDIFSDSKLVCNQYNKLWKCNVERFIEFRSFLYDEVRYGRKMFNNRIRVSWISRGKNEAGIYLDSMMRKERKENRKR